MTIKTLPKTPNFPIPKASPLIINTPDWTPPIENERPVLDLEKRAFDINYFNLRLIGTWRQDTKLHQGCMVIVERHRSLPKTNPYVIMQDNAWTWAEESTDVYPEFKMVLNAMSCCEFLDCLDPVSNKDIYRVLSAVREHLTDLKNLGPQPYEGRTEAGHLIIKTPHNGKVRMQEVYDDV